MLDIQTTLIETKHEDECVLETYEVTTVYGSVRVVESWVACTAQKAVNHVFVVVGENERSLKIVAGFAGQDYTLQDFMTKFYNAGE